MFQSVSSSKWGSESNGRWYFSLECATPVLWTRCTSDIPPQVRGSMRQDFFKEVKKGFKSGLKKRSQSDVGRGAKRGTSTALKNEVKRKIRRKLNDVFGA